MFSCLGLGCWGQLLHSLSGWGHRGRVAALAAVMFVLGLVAAPAQAAVNLQINSVKAYNATGFGVPATNSMSSLSIYVGNTGSTTASFPSGTLNFTLQLPPHMSYSGYAYSATAGYATCRYLSGNVATTGLVVNCSSNQTGVPAGGSVAFNVYVIADAASVGVTGTVRAAVDVTGGNTWVDPSSCTATSAPYAGCFVGPLMAPNSAGTPIMAARVGAPSTTVVGQPAQFSVDVMPYLLSGASTSVTVRPYLELYFRLPPYYTYGGIASKPGRPNAALDHTCHPTGGTLATGLEYGCYNTTYTYISLNNTSPSGAAGWLVTATPTRFAGGRMRLATPPIPGGGTNGGGGGNYADPVVCVSDDVPLGCGYGASVPDGVNLGLAVSNPGTLSVGGSSSYTLMLSNRGTLASSDTVVVYVQLPAYIQYDAVSPTSSGTVSANSVSCAASGAVSAGQLLACTVSLPPGGLGADQSAALNINVTPQPGASGASVVTQAAVDTLGTNAAQTPANCTDADTPNPGCAVTPAMVVGNGVSLVLTKSNPPELRTGNASAYGLVVSNVGTGPTGTTLVLYEKLPPNIGFTSATNVTPPGGTALSAVKCVLNAGSSISAGSDLTCTLTLPAGGFCDADGDHRGQLRRDRDPGRCQRGRHQPGHGGVRGLRHGCGSVAGQHHLDRCDQDGQRSGFVHHHRHCV